MLRSLFLSSILLVFLFLGTQAPFVFSLAYLWVSIIRPQDISYGFLSMIPTSMLTGALAIGSYLLLDRKSPPKFSAPILFLILFAILVTMSTFLWAEVPDFAYTKWDWAYKNILFSVLIIYVFRSRVQIEAFLQIYIFSLSAHFSAGALKVLRGGGGYGRILGLLGGNTGLGEGATLAAVAVMAIPMLLFLAKYTILAPPGRIFRLGYLGLAAAALICAIGSYQRTGLIALAVLGAGLWLRSRQKILFAILIIAIALVAFSFVSEDWQARMNTIETPTTEASALGRILVWQWTLQYVMAKPLGGGFGAYLVNVIVFPSANPTDPPIVSHGKAFHSIYFEVLGEHGWPGLFLFLGLFALSFLRLQRIIGRARELQDHAWCVELARQLQVSLAVLAASGAFIGIAFQPMIYYLIALTECTYQFMLRAVPAPSRQAAAVGPPAQRPQLARPTSWRDRRPTVR